MTDLIGGHVSMMFLSILPVLEHVRAGALSALAITSGTRSDLLPEVPTIAQSGMPGFAAALRTALAAEDVRARLAAEGDEPLAGTPEDYAADIDREETRWGALVRKLNLKIE
jgi:tripartite-type tricarboxylate transporter receptor subunit TctC